MPRIEILVVAAIAGGIACTPSQPNIEGPQTKVARSGLRRLTQHEYDNTLRDLIGDTTRPGSSILPTDFYNPFDNDYTLQVASQALIDGADLLAADAITRLLAEPARLATVVGCTPTSADDQGCFRQFVSTFGRRALRRALSEEDLAPYLAFQQFSREDGDFYAGVEAVLRAMLEDPRFLYRVESGTPDPENPGLLRLDDWEMASRLSYLLWGTTPSDALLDLAEGHHLSTPTQVRVIAEQMLEVEKAMRRTDRFHALWLGYDRLQHSPSLTAALRGETAALIDRVLFQEKRPWQDLFRMDETFLDDSLADHYGLPRPNSTTPVWVPYGESGRRGILSHGSFLSMGAKFSDTSPTRRGLFIRTMMFCQDVPPPPPSIDADNPPQAPNVVCKQDRYDTLRQGTCAGCHKSLNGIGFGLENFDAQGRYRAAEADHPECNISGQGYLDDKPFHGPTELSTLLIQNSSLNQCLTSQLYRFAIGRNALDDSDQQSVQALVSHIGSGDFRFDDLLLRIVSSPAFAYRQEEE